MFSIVIPIDLIEKNNLQNDYINTFNKINKSNYKYNSKKLILKMIIV